MASVIRPETVLFWNPLFQDFVLHILSRNDNVYANRLFKVLFGITTIKKQRLINVCAVLDCRKKAKYSMVISRLFRSENVNSNSR